MYRLLEMLPAFLVWSTFILILVVSFAAPLWAIYFIIIFDLYWLIRVIYLLTYLVIAYSRLRRSLKVDWLAECRQKPGWERLYHLVVLPFSKEGIEVVEPTLAALASSAYPLDKVIVVLAGEERNRENAEAIFSAVRPHYGHRFFRFLETVHPANVPGELAGKGANAAYAGREAQKLIDALGIPYEDVIVSSFDVDTCPHPQYFAHLTKTFLSQLKPTRCSYQPVPLFNNNIWQSPAVMRVVSMGTTFWLMTEQSRPDRLITFSSHAMSFRALVDVGFWQSDIVTEDSRIFLQCLVRYDGDYQVVPLYISVSMDTVLAPTFTRSVANLYKQQRRWAWGIEHFPYLVWHLAQRSRLALTKKLKFTWIVLDGMYSWATAPIVIFVLGRLPLAIAGDDVRSTVIAQNAPYVLQGLMLAAMVGLFFAALITVTMLPPRPPGQHRSAFLLMIVQWLLFPLTMIAFGSIPATDAQTRLAFGRYLGFNVTSKFRKGETRFASSTAGASQ